MRPGIDVYDYMSQAAAALKQEQDRKEVETVLDELEFLYEDAADQLIAQYRERLASL
jgi:L-serine deaminase